MLAALPYLIQALGSETILVSGCQLCRRHSV